MTVLENFVAFAKSLPIDKLGTVEDALSMLMVTHAPHGEFSATELGELDRRLAEPKPAYAAQAAIDELLGRTGRA